jgi:hypothetical protein
LFFGEAFDFSTEYFSRKPMSDRARAELAHALAGPGVSALNRPGIAAARPARRMTGRSTTSNCALLISEAVTNDQLKPEPVPSKLDPTQNV